MKRNNKKGFTIVELVIVIAVIAILAAVMIPTFGGVIDKANESKALQEAQNAIKVVTAEYAAKGETVSNATIYIFEDDVATSIDNDKITYKVEYTNGSLGDPSDTTTTVSYASGNTAYANTAVTIDTNATAKVLEDLGKNIIVVVTAPAAESAT